MHFVINFIPEDDVILQITFDENINNKIDQIDRTQKANIKISCGLGFSYHKTFIIGLLTANLQTDNSNLMLVMEKREWKSVEE